MRLRTRSTMIAITAATAWACAVLVATSAAAIVGGTEPIHDYPGEVAASVTFDGEGTAACTGSMIRPTVMFVAAHCVTDDRQAPTPVAVPADHIRVQITAPARRLLLGRRRPQRVARHDRHRRTARPGVTVMNGNPCSPTSAEWS
jgi:hypothetical protein